MQNENAPQPRGDDRRRDDWQSNDRRQTWPWVMDSNDRRSGEDRRVKERRAPASTFTLRARYGDW